MVRFLALGDSYTVGESVDPSDAWPRQLPAQLPEFEIEPTLLAATGWSSGELLTVLTDGPGGPFDLVSLSIGVNDQYRGTSAGDFAINAALLLDGAAALAGGFERVFVVSIPDWGVMPFAAELDREKITEEIDEFNAELARLALGRGAAFIDVTSISRESAGRVAEDGLHPSARQYRDWVEVIAPVVAALLSPTR